MSSGKCNPPRALHGYGTFVRMYDNQADEWLVIGGTMDLPLPSVTREKVETNDDDGDGSIYYMGSPQVDIEDFEFEADFILNQHTRLLNIMQSNAVYYTCWQVVLNTPQQQYFEWCGFLTKLSGNAPKKDIVKATIAIATSGGGLRQGNLVA
jgi:hypothetical protein